MRDERMARSAARGGLRVFERKREELVGNSLPEMLRITMQAGLLRHRLLKDYPLLRIIFLIVVELKTICLFIVKTLETVGGSFRPVFGNQFPYAIFRNYSTGDTRVFLSARY